MKFDYSCECVVSTRSVETKMQLQFRRRHERSSRAMGSRLSVCACSIAPRAPNFVPVAPPGTRPHSASCLASQNCSIGVPLELPNPFSGFAPTQSNSNSSWSMFASCSLLSSLLTTTKYRQSSGFLVVVVVAFAERTRGNNSIWRTIFTLKLNKLERKVKVFI